MKRTKHNLSNYRLQTMNMGQLVPVQVIDVLPGDTIRLETSALIRMSPMLAPVMHPVTVRLHHWFVPYRLIWDGFEDFITGGADGNNADTVPKLEVTDASAHQGALMDYMGIPTDRDIPLSVSALPFAAYNLIWNEFYRDQDLQTTLLETDATAITGTDAGIQRVSWRKDYFTAARPFQQKGNDITLPIGTRAPIRFDRADGNSSAPLTGREVGTGIYAPTDTNSEDVGQQAYADLQTRS